MIRKDIIKGLFKRRLLDQELGWIVIYDYPISVVILRFRCVIDKINCIVSHI